MAVNAQDVKNKLAERAQVPAKGQPGPAATIAQYLKKMEPEIKRALPKHLDPDRLARVALTTIRTNPALLECSIQSLMAGVMQAAQLGLEPGLLGHCYLVPFHNSKTGTKEAQFIIGYKGLIDLARRSGNIQSITAHAVHENDHFEFEYGLEEKLIHKPALTNRGAPYAYYAVAKFKDGGHQILVMSKEDIERHRKRSKAANAGPWVTDYDEMAKKTVIRAMAKYLPISVEVQKAILADESVKREISEDMTEVPDLAEYNTIDIPPEEQTEEAANAQ